MTVHWAVPPEKRGKGRTSRQAAGMGSSYSQARWVHARESQPEIHKAVGPELRQHFEQR